jgi:ferredoxin
MRTASRRGGFNMTDRPRTILICSCEDTMPLDAQAVRRGCGGSQITTARQLCRAELELERYRAAVTAGAALTVGCTQEAPLFSEIAGSNADVRFANIRETAGWSAEAADAGPKMAALLAVAAEPEPAVPFVALTSAGVILIYGRDAQAIEAADLLKDHLDVTVLITPPAELTPKRLSDFPVVRGNIRLAKGHLGAFELTIDDYAQPSPSSRDALVFGPAKDNAVSRCDIVLDISGHAPLFPAADLRDGYLRADPGDPAAVLKAVLKARDLVGTFDKPRYITFTQELCAHSRSRIVGCTRCLDLCPTGAIAPAGDHVAIDARICAGCGQCAAACPTGAAAYALPPADALMRKLRLLLTAYRNAGGERAIVLLHDEPHGAPLIDALARFGDGLPANVLPLCVNEVTQVGLEAVAAAFAYGASALVFLLHEKPRHDIAGLAGTLALADPILLGLGFGSERAAKIETDDPDVLGQRLRAMMATAPAPRPSGFLPAGPKREVLRLALRELHGAAPAPVDIIALPTGAPFGAVEVDAKSCTLCLACVSACPTGALLDDPERPMLRFVEDACVQCGLCKATCPEKVITLKPQLDFRAATSPARVLNEQEPFCCIRCGKAFGVRSTIERVVAALADKHWMYQGADRRLDAIKMCADCRVIAVTEAELAAAGGRARAATRTTDDYLRERDAQETKPKG